MSVNPVSPVRQAAIAAGIALSLSCAAAWSADPSQRVVVTAARAPQTPEQLIADVVVIDAEQIDRAGPVGLAELLQRHAGVELSANGGTGQVSGVFLRGANTNHVVLLIDGVRVNSATSGTNALEHVPLQQIERIEVLRGPASSLYGADAIGGVIQIFTRTVDGVRAKVSAGSDRLREVHAGIGRVMGDTTWSLSAGSLDVKAFSATNATHPFSFNPDDDPYRNANVNARLQHRWAEGHRITLRGLATRAATQR
jgi:vitamin B12 transporter